MLLTRRRMLQVSALTVAACTFRVALARPETKSLALALRKRFTEIESATGGRLGVAMLGTGNGFQADHRGNELFPMCSTYKFLAVAALLARVDKGRENIERRILFAAEDLVVYSPITKNHVGGDGMSLAELCDAALTYSDNTAGNLLLAILGGPSAVTAYARSIGDTVSRLDRTEPELNEAAPGDVRDTTSPQAMLVDLDALLLGNALSNPSRKRLNSWLLANKTGAGRLRAGVPDTWQVGDKTGAGERGTANDIGILTPPGRDPILVTTFLTGATVSSNQRYAVIASVAAAITASLTG